MEFLKHMGDLGSNYRLPTLEKIVGELGEDKLVFIRVYDAGVCHGPVPALENKFSLRVDT